jgi:A118 family predicted phage portal protein
MFAKILNWIREAFKKMIDRTSVKTALHVDVAISPEMTTALQVWSVMYENKAEWLDGDVQSLNLPAAIAGEIARAVTIEMGVSLTGSARATFLAAQLAPVLGKVREQVERGCAKGGLMMKPYVDGDGISVDFVQADQFFPVSFDANGNITACVFADQRTVGDRYYTRLEFHTMTAQGCEIRNEAFRSSTRDTLGQPVPLTSIPEWAELLPEALITGIDRPLYAYFRYPLANNIDATSPLGVSCYSRAVNLIRDADVQWSNLLWEFESGKRAVYVDTLAFGKDAQGQAKLPNKRLYRALDAGGQKDDFFQAWSPEFREASIQSGLNAILQRIEFNCGLAYGTLSDPQAVEKTATEIAVSKQRTYATITDTQKTLQAALDQLIWAMDVWATLANLAPRGTYQVAYTFDDSIVVDKDAQMVSDRQTTMMGAMPKYIFLMRNYGLDEATAKRWIAETQSEQPEDMFGAEAGA